MKSSKSKRDLSDFFFTFSSHAANNHITQSELPRRTGTTAIDALKSCQLQAPSWIFISKQKLPADLLPIEVPRHDVLELGGDSPIKARPRQLVAGLPLQVRVAQGHADVIQEAG